ncbi:MAG: hypothetical protein IKN34_05565 [Treponema sp.]|nr:hypothetical protein [Treponema sp.]
MKKKILFILIILIASVLCAEESYFDSYVYQNWNSFGGIRGATATDIVQSKDGYINVGTYEGLVRFDGIRFTTIKRQRDNELKFASVRAMYEDSHGGLWIGSNDEGVQCISAEGNKWYSMENGLPNNSIRAIMEDKKGNIWIGTASGVVYITPNGHLINAQFQPGTVSKGVIANSLYCDTAGRVWLTTLNERGLFMFSDGLFRMLDEMDGFGDYLATAISQDKHGDFWIGLGNDGLVRVRNGHVSRVRTDTFLDNSSTWTIYPDDDGSIWFGSEAGVCVFDSGKFHENSMPGLSDSKINRIVKDRESNIWIATDRNGIGKLLHGKFKMCKLSYSSNAIAQDLEGNMWVGTDKGVLCYDSYDQKIENSLTEFTKGLRIRHVGVASNGDILVSCYTKPGQLRWSKDGMTSWTTDNGLVGNKVRVAIQTAPHELYVGTTTGLSIIHADGSIKNIKQTDGLENEYVMCIYKDKNGIVWIGTDGNGIYLMKDERIFANISSKDGLAGNIIFKIIQDEGGSLWVCTGTGITRCPSESFVDGLPKQFQNLTSEHGLGTDSVFQLIDDKTGNFWLTSNYGISTVNAAEIVDAAYKKKDKVNVKFYSQNDGLDSEGPTSTALGTCDKNGRIWLPMVDGFAVYDPVNVLKVPVKPLVHIESVTIDNVEYSNLSKEYILNPGTKRVEIRFTGLSFDAPERIKFMHCLTRFENGMSEPDSARVVSYTNLKPGKHKFILAAVNGEGIMSEKDEAMLFVQKPYFYQMPVFWVLLATLVLTSIITAFLLKQRAIRRENIRLEKMVQIRTEELAAEKDKSDQLLRAILPDKIADELKDNRHSIGDNFEDVTMLFSDIVSFTKTSQNYTASEIVDALNDLFCLFDERAKSMGVEKIKTIGDAYMAACGLPTLNPKHAQIMVAFAKGMYEDLDKYNKTAKIRFQMRVGLNSGPVTAGVIGKTKFIYDVWGDTVNTASRMESACTPGHIRVSENVRNRLSDSSFEFSEPIQCDIKGKGVMTTYEVF